MTENPENPPDPVRASDEAERVLADQCARMSLLMDSRSLRRASSCPSGIMDPGVPRVRDEAYFRGVLKLFLLRRALYGSVCY